MPVLVAVVTWFAAVAIWLPVAVVEEDSELRYFGLGCL